MEEARESAIFWHKIWKDCNVILGQDIITPLDKLEIMRKKLRNITWHQQSGLVTNHIIYGCPVLWKFLSMVFNVMMTHSFDPSINICSTIIPMPRNNRKSLNDSNNYRSL